MILTPPDTPFFLRNGNADTIAAKFLQRPAPAYRRELLPDSTGKTKVAYDFSDGISPDAPLVVLFHGLEGGSGSHYAVELMRPFPQLRRCSEHRLGVLPLGRYCRNRLYFGHARRALP